MEEQAPGHFGARLVAIYETFEAAFEGWERRMATGDYYLEEWILGTQEEDDT